jgi:hypothetical protein
MEYATRPIFYRVKEEETGSCTFTESEMAVFETENYMMNAKAASISDLPNAVPEHRPARVPIA